jgi:DNA-directed RNA polymerase sigma subunit (sigma70/sigma32)
MKEYPTDPVKLHNANKEARRTPFTPWEALMTSTDDSIGTSVLEMVALREVINDAIDEVLTPLELWVFNSLFVERKSLRVLAKELAIPKTTIARIRDRATEKLRQQLLSKNVIQEYLNR